MLPIELSLYSYTFVLNTFLTVFMLCMSAYIFYTRAQDTMSMPYRISVALCATIAFTTALHALYTIYQWHTVYHYIDGHYTTIHAVFNMSYRYVGMLCSLPLVLTAFITLLDTTSQKTSLIIRLALCALGMVILGYCGIEISDIPQKIGYVLGSNIFLCYILFVLWFELLPTIKKEDPSIIPSIQIIRNTIMLFWPLYTVLDLAIMLDILKDAVITQSLYAVTDMLTQLLPTVLIFYSATLKTQLYSVSHE